jgi:uncharacterized caspase-like protein
LNRSSDTRKKLALSLPGIVTAAMEQRIALVIGNSAYSSGPLKNPVNDVFMNVRTKVKKETGQVPWELSSLEGRFYFTPQGSTQDNPPSTPSYKTQ